MMHVFELLAREDELHRVPIVNENRQLVNLVTQSKVIKFLHRHMDQVGTKVSATFKKKTLLIISYH